MAPSAPAAAVPVAPGGARTELLGVGFGRSPGARARLWAQLQEHVGDVHGWHLAQSGHYFFLSSVADEGFRSELLDRAEEVRVEVRALFPHPDGDPIDFDLPLPLIRICKEVEQYSAYGGPAGSCAYWSPVAREMVGYDAARTGGRAATWHALQGVLFNAYFDEIHGTARRIGPWFEIGFQLWFAGLERTPEGYAPRLEARVREVLLARLRDNALVPLADVLAAPKAAFAQDELLRAEAAGLVWFLLRGQERDAHGRGRWETLLPRYYEAWRAGTDETRARELAFGDRPDGALEEAFRSWIAGLSGR